MDINLNDINILEYNLKNNSHSTSDKNGANDVSFFLYNFFLLNKDTSLFNLMFARNNVLQNIIQNRIPGSFVELGVMKGAFTFQIIKTLMMNGVNTDFYIFDFFETNIEMENINERIQIEEIYDRVKYNRKSPQDFDKHARDIRFNNLHCIPGNIEKTLGNFLNTNNTKFCFVYIDVDVENPTFVSLSKIWDRVVTNGIIVIDDYNSKKWGPFSKVDEFLKSKNCKINKLHHSLKEGIVIEKLN